MGHEGDVLNAGVTRQRVRDLRLRLAVDRPAAHPVDHHQRTTVRQHLAQLGETAHQPLQSDGIGGADGHHVVGRVSQYELSALTAEHYEVIVGLRQQTTAVFHEAILWGMRDEAFGVVDAHRVVRAVLSLGVDLVRWYRLDGADTPEQLGRFYAELALGMVTAAGNAVFPPRENCESRA